MMVLYVAIEGEAEAKVESMAAKRDLVTKQAGMR